MHCTERRPTKTNVNKAAFPERISLGTLDPYAHGRWSRGRVHRNILDTQMEGRREARQVRYRKVRCAENRSTPGSKLPKTSHDPEGRDPETAR